MNAPYYTNESATVWHGDCLEVLRDLPDNSVDAIVTDPPYGLGFMGKDWDDLPPGLPWAQECLRVLKPGGHLLAFGGTRTWHRLAVAVEDAGFEVRDSIAWLYGSGFPKSLDVSKAIERTEVAPDPAALLPEEESFCQWMRDHSGLTEQQARELFTSARFLTGVVEVVNTATVARPRMGRRAMVPTASAWEAARPFMAEPPAWVEALVKNPPKPPMQTPSEWKAGKGRDTEGGSTPAAQQWAGWGTALKPAFEPIVVARKPLVGTVAANVLAHGVGALNIDATRVEGRERTEYGLTKSVRTHGGVYGEPSASADFDASKGRWPTNVVLDDHAAAELDEQSGTTRSTVRRPTGRDTRGIPNGNTPVIRVADTEQRGTADEGGASRFFPVFKYQAKAPTRERPKVDGVAHPTCKPLALIRWLVRLVTPPGGVVLDPFAGSGTTGEACALEGFRAILVERETAYLPLIVARLSKPTQGGLFAEGSQ